MQARTGEVLEDKFIIRRIQNHVDNGINGENGDVTQVRQTAYSRYLGEQYGNERPGYSSFVTREVLEAVEWAKPALIRVFMGGVRPVEFRPKGPGDEQQAKHETEVVHYWFFEAGGFMAFLSWITDILLYPNGYIMVVPEETLETETKTLEHLHEEQLAQFEEEGWTVNVDADYTEEPGFVDATISREKTVKSVGILPVPPDHCIIEHSHNKLDLDDAAFVCLRVQKTYSDLRSMGYTAEQLEDLGGQDDSETWNDEGVRRHFYEDENPEGNDDAYTIQADELYWTHDCYMRIDYDQDGISEPRHVFMAGCKILENEPLDFMPVVAATAIPQTHKHIGMGYAEIVSDLQLLMTTLTRQLLDNIYRNNVQRKFVSEGAMLSDNRTMDALLDGRSEVIVVRGDPNAAILPEVSTPLVAEIAGVIEQIKGMPQMRTGVAPQVSLDPSVLEKSTMGAFLGALDQASQRLEMLARIFAESALSKAFQKIHHVLREYHDEAQPIQIKGQWVQPKPSTWSKRANMTVNVGLGFNNQQMMLTLLESLLRVQKEAISAGLADPKKIFATLEKLIDHANLGHAETFFLDPNAPGWKPPPPQEDPAMITAKASAKALEAEAQRKDMELQLNHSRDIAKLEQDGSVNMEKARAEAMKGYQALMDHKLKVVTAEDVRAKTAAEITALNRDPKKGGDEAKDSSKDEFSFAKSTIDGGQKKAS